MQDFIKIHSSDNVAVALAPLSKGRTLDIAGTSIILLEDIPQGHKFALFPIPVGSKVIKYGNPIH